MHETLKNCPFCGAAAHFEMDEGRWEWVECESCGMQGNRSASLMEDCKPKLVEAWNRRAPAPVGVEPVARLEIEKTKGGVSLTHIAEPAAFQLQEGMYALYTTPQPTQAQAGAVPPEAEPIVLNCEAPGDLKPGDYVFASRWSDCDPGDPWEVGFVSEVGVYPESMTKAGYVVLQGGSRRWGRAMRITPEQGLRICEQFPSMERLPQDYDAIARVFGIKGGQHGADT